LETSCGANTVFRSVQRDDRIDIRYLLSDGSLIRVRFANCWYIVDRACRINAKRPRYIYEFHGIKPSLA
jgi:hypothetical protein